MRPSPLRRLQHGRGRSRGQSLAEFALVFPVLMLIIGGIIQFGIIFWGQNTLNQVVRDTGRWAATQELDCQTGGGQATLRPQVDATARTVAASSSMIGTVNTVTVDWTGAPCPPNDNQDEAWVHITMTSTVPIFFPFVPGNGSISSETRFRMEPTAP